MENLFTGVSAEAIKEGIKVQSGGVNKSGIHKIVDTTVYIYETEWNKKTFTNASMVVTLDSGAKLEQSLNTKTKSNQKVGETDLFNFMGYIAMCTARETEFDGLAASFGELPVETFTDRYKKEHQAKVINIFANAKYSIVTTPELSLSDSSIFTKQVIDIRRVFRDVDNASSDELKDNDETKFGRNYDWWNNPDNTEAKISLEWNKNNYNGWGTDDREVKPEALEAMEYYKEGGKLYEELPNQEGVAKEDKERVANLFLEGLSCKEVTQKLATLKGGTSTATNTSEDIDEDANEDDTPPFMA